MTAAPPAPAPPHKPLRAAFLEPRSIGLLVLALVLAAAFAALGQWQISRAIEQGTVVQRPTERVLPLTRIAEPAEQQTDASVGQRTRTTGRLVPADTLVAGDRLQHGRRGWWVVGHAVVDDPAGAQLAVALGWAPTEAEARAAAERARATPPRDMVLTGRYVDSDGATATTSGDPDALVGVSTARLVNLWTVDPGGPTYEGVLTLEDAPDGLTPIWSPRPGEEVELNLLNLLYAVEWAFFAVAAFYVWYRLVRDRWEQEAAALAADPEPIRHDV
jgi:cytochrome oxidase assembly protein ShyY1